MLLAVVVMVALLLIALAVAAPVVAVGAIGAAVVVKDAMLPLVVPVAFWATASK